MPNEDSFFGMEHLSINAVHDESLIQHFEDGIGRKALVITPSFPYVFIGEIINIVEDFVVMDIETTPIQDLEDRNWHIHIHNIEVFFIERDDGPRIPELQDDIC